jgi:hypothetical protein
MTTILFAVSGLFASLAWLSATGDFWSAWIVGNVFVFGVAVVIYIARTEPIQTETEAVLYREKLEVE